MPALEGLIDVDYLTSTTMMDVDFLPEHLIVIGGSYIGLEFAQMYRRFGSQVTVIEMAPQLIAREDEAVSQAVREILEPKASVCASMHSVLQRKSVPTVSPSK